MPPCCHHPAQASSLSQLPDPWPFLPGERPHFPGRPDRPPWCRVWVLPGLRLGAVAPQSRQLPGITLNPGSGFTEALGPCRTQAMQPVDRGRAGATPLSAWHGPSSPDVCNDPDLLKTQHCVSPLHVPTLCKGPLPPSPGALILEGWVSHLSGPPTAPRDHPGKRPLCSHTDPVVLVSEGIC